MSHSAFRFFAFFVFMSSGVQAQNFTVIAYSPVVKVYENKKFLFLELQKFREMEDDEKLDYFSVLFAPDKAAIESSSRDLADFREDTQDQNERALKLEKEFAKLDADDEAKEEKKIKTELNAHQAREKANLMVKQLAQKQESLNRRIADLGKKQNKLQATPFVTGNHLILKVEKAGLKIVGTWRGAPSQNQKLSEGVATDLSSAGGAKTTRSSADRFMDLVDRSSFRQYSSLADVYQSLQAAPANDELLSDDTILNGDVIYETDEENNDRYRAILQMQMDGIVKNGTKADVETIRASNQAREQELASVHYTPFKDSLTPKVSAMEYLNELQKQKSKCNPERVSLEN